MRVLIILETLRIGGIERNALDQAYLLSDRGDLGLILVFNQNGTMSNANFITNEKSMIVNKKMDIRFCNAGLISRIQVLFKILVSERIDLVIDYTLVGNLLTRVARLFARKKVPIHCVVQQLASLSAPAQRYKRMIYAQFATRLFINTVNYGVDWVFYVNKNLITRFIFRKKFEIIRNGVYLPRIHISELSLQKNHLIETRFIFLGRLKAWKGFSKLKNIDKASGNKANFLIITSEIDKPIVDELIDIFDGRIEFIFGKTLKEFTPMPGDVHVYPVDYGVDAIAIESVSTNCLEMALLGIPSMVTNRGAANWPELTHSGLVQEIDWENSESISNGIEKCKKINFEQINFEQIKNSINIERNLEAHFSYLRNYP